MLYLVQIDQEHLLSAYMGCVKICCQLCYLLQLCILFVSLSKVINGECLNVMSRVADHFTN